MSKQEQHITRETQFEIFFPFFVERYFEKGTVEKYLHENQSPYDYQTLHSFLQSEIAKNKFKKSWDYERSEIWGDRSLDMAISETIGHSLSTIAEEIEIYLVEKDPQCFPNLSREEILSLQAKVGTLIDYFRETLHDPSR